MTVGTFRLIAGFLCALAHVSIVSYLSKSGLNPPRARRTGTDGIGQRPVTTARRLMHATAPAAIAAHAPQFHVIEGSLE
jgi:hypothetical protein